MKGHPVGSLCVVVKPAEHNVGAVVRILGELKYAWIRYTHSGRYAEEWCQEIEFVTPFLSRGSWLRGDCPLMGQIECLRPLSDPYPEDIETEREVVV